MKFPNVVALSRVFLARKTDKIGGEIEIVVGVSPRGHLDFGKERGNFADHAAGHGAKTKRREIFSTECRTFL